MSAAPAEDWQPGDALHARGSYTNYLFNIRPAIPPSWADAASWPEPALGRGIPDDDHWGRWFVRLRAEESALGGTS